MSPPSDAEAKSFLAAVESLTLEADTLLERLPPREVLAALFMAAFDVARDHRVSASHTAGIFGRVFAEATRRQVLVSVHYVQPIDDDEVPD